MLQSKDKGWLNREENKTHTYATCKSPASDQKIHIALADVAQWIECQPANQRSLVQFPVRVHVSVVG